MTDIVLQKNVGALVTVKNGSTSTSITAAGTGDATVKNGITIDRIGISGNAGSMPMSAVAAVLVDATLASGNTAKVAITVQEGPDGSNWSDYVTTASTTVLTGASGGAAQSGAISLNVDLSSCRRYVRLNHVPDLSAAGTDTALTRGVLVLAGQDRLPAAAST
jgi:hypothetical protein